jgi:hypothetical protein
LLSEKLRIEDGRDFENGPNSIANLDREMLVKRSFYDRVAGKRSKRHIVRRFGVRSSTTSSSCDRARGPEVEKILSH